MLKWTRIANMETYALPVPGGVLIRVGREGSMIQTKDSHNEAVSVVFVPDVILDGENLTSSAVGKKV
jgi:hypothetical protein